MEYEIMMKLLLAVLFGGAIGYVRELTKKAAGLRTHILVCLGSAIFTVISILIAKEYSGADPTRIASSIVTGIGFLGAGTIFQSGGSVKGLTTAASIWVCASIGMAVGAGFYSVASFATMLALIVIQLFQVIEKKFFRASEREQE